MKMLINLYAEIQNNPYSIVAYRGISDWYKANGLDNEAEAFLELIKRKIDVKNLLHFLALRCDSHAQYETRVFADAILDLIKPIIPITVEAWDDYHDYRGAVKLTRLEIESIKSMLEGKMVAPLNSDNKREQLEWIEKAAKLGLCVSNE